ncbi:MAG TPA: DUF6084 family protein [Blastocatellia bacterium]|nr:DUF6084 family protein [Blastocatellia bacterium]
MPDLSFEVEKAEAVPFAAAPLLAFKLRVSNSDAEEPIHTIALRCQIMIDPARRGYRGEDQGRLRDLFGEPERWGQTLRPMLWTHTSVVVPSFTGGTTVELPVPCTFDFNVAATKYFAGLADGEVPLNLQFSGTVFYVAESGALQVAQIPWEKEARYRLPVEVWNQMMEIYYPNSAWLCLRRDVFDRLYRYKVRHGIPTWEQALERVLPEEGPDTEGNIH